MYKTRFKIVCLNLQFCAAMKPGDIILKYLILTHSNNLVSLEITIYFRITNKDQNWVADILFCLNHLWSDSSDGSKGDRTGWLGHRMNITEIILDLELQENSFCLIQRRIKYQMDISLFPPVMKVNNDWNIKYFVSQQTENILWKNLIYILIFLKSQYFGDFANISNLCGYWEFKYLHYHGDVGSRWCFWEYENYLDAFRQWISWFWGSSESGSLWRRIQQHHAVLLWPEWLSHLQSSS